MSKETQTDAPERFAIDSEAKAAWYLGKLRAIESEKDAIKAATGERLAQLDADAQGLRDRFQSELEAWAKGESERRRRKTITLPLAGASVAFRTVGASLTLSDRLKAADVALTLGFQTQPAADLTAYQKHAAKVFEETGELLPGMDRTEARESFSIAFGGKGTKRGEAAPVE